MRCPKCGYNSFDHLESCKKCGKDLSEHKSKFDIKSILLSGFLGAKAEPTEVEEIVEEPLDEIADLEPVVNEINSVPVTEQPIEESASEDFGFNFADESDEDEDLAFDELFEESPLEEAAEEPLPAPADTSFDKTDETLLDDDLELDLGEEDDLATDFGLDEPEALDEDLSSITELGLDESDFANFDDDDALGTMEDPKRPFDRVEPPEATEAPLNSTAEEMSAPGDPFIADDGFQEELFKASEELPPLPETSAQLESLETSFGGKSFEHSPIGASDDFTLGALPATGLSDSSDVTDPALTEQEDPTPEPVAKDETTQPEQPQSEEQDTVSPPFSRRISAFFCDMTLLGLVGFCFIIVAETALSDNSDGFFPSLETMIDLAIPYFLVIFCLMFGYFTLFHFLAGQTPGKMVASMRVETCKGEPLSFSQAFMRSVGGLIQLLPAGLGYLSVLLHKEGRGWNDRLAGTRLVDLKTAMEEEVFSELEKTQDGALESVE